MVKLQSPRNLKEDKLVDEETPKTEKDSTENKQVPAKPPATIMSFDDLFNTQRIEEQKRVDLRETGEIIEAYWEKGWVSDFCFFHRTDFDKYQNKYHRTYPTRYKLWNYKFTKNQRRVLQKNKDLKTIIRPLRITQGKIDLFDGYHISRFEQLPRKELPDSYKYIKYYPSKLMELCIFKDERLIACSIFEVGTFSIYSNTAFWSLAEKHRGLGTLTILLEIEYALQLGFYYYYMGFYYKQNPNYQYKTRFRGLELYSWDKGYWIPYEMAAEMLDQPMPRRENL